MSKDESTQLKGIAILMMLWLHLFSDINVTEECANLVFYKGKPLAYMLTKLASCCVPLYTFLGGYGLAATFRNRQGQMNNRRRALLLMVNFWVVCLLFIPLGCLFRPDIFPGSWSKLLLNLTGISCSYNGAWWFLLPYVLITLCSKSIIGTLFRSNIKQETAIIGLLLLGHIGAYIYKEVGNIEQDSLELLIITGTEFVYLLFMFALGVTALKHKWVENLRQRLQNHQLPWPNLLLFLTLMAVCFLRISIGNSALLHPPFVVAIVLLYALLDKPKGYVRAAMYLGGHSTNLWLCHFFFICMLLQNQIYQLRYPIAIFLGLTVLSLLASYLIRAIHLPVKQAILARQ